MDGNLSSIWIEVKGRVGEELDNANVQMLLSGSRPLAYDDGRFLVSFASDFARDWVEARHLSDLQRCLNELLGESCELQLVGPAQADLHLDKGKNGKPQLPLNVDATPKAREGRRRKKRTPVPDSDPDDSWPSPLLNPRYTFDTFVVGSGNRFAHAASLAVAAGPASAYNPLFLYGGVGLGKTHLMQAIGHYVLANHRRMNVVYVSSERFTNDLIHAIGTKSMVEFRGKYRNSDVLLVDDIQFVAGKESTQEEFFHTFNALYEASKQIVISSDRPPKEIPTLEERLRSRFEWGLTADIQAPDLETRVAILNRKARAEGLVVPDDVLYFIANHVHSNIRELEGALIRVIAFASLHNLDIDIGLANEALGELLRAAQPKQITIESIQQTVSSHFGIDVADMKAKRRNRAIAYPRQIAMYLSRELTDASLPQIGEKFGGRDHSTVIHAIDRVKSQVNEHPPEAATVRELVQKLKGK